MKKLISTILATAMIMAMGVTAFAEEYAGNTVNGGTQDTTVKTSIASEYTVTIPAEVTIDFDAATSEEQTITLSDEHLAKGYWVDISCPTTGEMTNGTDNTTLAFSVVKTDGTSEFEALKLKTASKEGTFKIAVEETAWNAATAGDYTGTLTFTIAYKNA